MQKNRNQLEGGGKATSRKQGIGGHQVNSWNWALRRHERMSRDQAGRSEKLFQIGDHSQGRARHEGQLRQAMVGHFWLASARVLLTRHICYVTIKSAE
jgi:hypothetical protein